MTPEDITIQNQDVQKEKSLPVHKISKWTDFPSELKKIKAENQSVLTQISDSNWDYINPDLITFFEIPEQAQKIKMYKPKEFSVSGGIETVRSLLEGEVLVKFEDFHGGSLQPSESINGEAKTSEIFKTKIDGIILQAFAWESWTNWNGGGHIGGEFFIWLVNHEPIAVCPDCKPEFHEVIANQDEALKPALSKKTPEITKSSISDKIWKTLKSFLIRKS